ncbi:hypothetical protein FISHEDRAFT_72469 [Fistulina hepatica ATCC 64428]|uniref:SUZ domain-containing protein n=1 Tax=Fistulina hepatica ATCC 64428 TaxID=1128425 RepID=A0A0D7AFC9_9AGAR|nr:hypothetical protein FISHEDRAFT_72469 [Fistulina hepatica ATCC 64428]
MYDIQILKDSDTRRAARKAAVVIPDDWEDEDDIDDDVEPTRDNNQRIWEAANAKTAAPMPTIVLGASSRGTSSAPPPPDAFKPTMLILRRPTSATPSQSPSPTPTQIETIREKEARYKAARARIFGDNEGDATAAAKPTTFQITRNPRGPENQEGPQGLAKGFAERRKKSTAPVPDLARRP